MRNSDFEYIFNVLISLIFLSNPTQVKINNDKNYKRDIMVL